ncbi:MAG TPA: DNA polymerase I [Candidatus Marinimicrobia bacterium]|nr:DNA polymerase I [Candidatus Neomarinimicrobiota bacterium]
MIKIFHIFMEKKETIFLIDGSALAYRSYFGTIRTRLATSKGKPTGAVFAFVNSLKRIIEEVKPDYLAIVFDAPEKTFRHQIYTDYKATREAMPEDLVAQLPVMFEIVKAMNIPMLTVPGYEADDVIGTLAKSAKNKGLQVFVVTGDKDFMQLVDDDILVYKPASGQKEVEILDKNAVVSKLGVQPDQITDYLGLVGDSSDNIPGIKGIGPAKAQPLLAQWGTLEKVIEQAESTGNPRLIEMLNNGAEIARLSKKLATIKTDVPLDVSIEALKIKPVNQAELERIYRELEFFSLIETKPEVSEVTKPEKHYKMIQTPAEVRELVKNLLNVELLSVDLETTSIDPMTAEIVGVALCWEANSGVYLPIRQPAATDQLFGQITNLEWLIELKPLLENEQIIKCGQNLKYDMLILRRNGIELRGKIFDTMVAAFLIQPDARSYKLDKLSQYYLNYKMQSIEELIGNGKDQLNMEQVDIDKVTFYAVEDADVVLQLVPIFEEKLKADQLWQVFEEIEMPLVPVLMQLELNGVYLDVKSLKEMSRALEVQIDAIMRRIYDLAGVEFNINSPKQLGEILFDKLNLPKVRGSSTDVSVLEKLQHKHPLPSAVLEYRGLVKLKNTYLDTLPLLVNKKTGRVHSSFNQTMAATGRLSSSDPNFQNIPIRTDIGREIRRAFIPQQNGWKILSADYSQIELRIMAHLSGDAELRRAFQEGVDVHARTAALVYGVPEKDVLPEMRRIAKVVNFGIMYGAGAFRMSEELGISRSDANKLIEQYFRTYPGINDYIMKTIEEARKNNYVKTLAGRRRYVPDINSENKNVREAAERVAINMPIQGTAADMIKIAMIRIQRQLNEKKFKSMMILQIHDELLFEVHPDELENLRPIVTTEMENALPLDVPVKVDIGIGNSWYEAH